MIQPLHAALITLNAGDAFGTSSFNAAGNWSNAAAPSPGNDYEVGIDRLRTPADGNNYVFDGDSLTVTASGRLMYKGIGTSATITIADLTLAGGLIDHRSSFADIFRLAGGLSITAPSVIAPQQGPIVIDSVISGTGDLTVPATDNSNGYTFTLNGVNTYTGSMFMSANVVLGTGGSLTFDIGANGLNNGIFGSGTATFDGVFNFDLTDASTNTGDSWTIVSTAATTFGSTFTVAGFTEMDNVWTSGNYEFSEASGVLTVVPEPSVALAMLGGFGLLLGRRRFRKAV